MICQMVNGHEIKLYIFKELKEETIMTPILSLHNVDVSAFLAVLDTCEGNVFLANLEAEILTFNYSHGVVVLMVSH